MADTQVKRVEDWEAGDHIADLQAGQSADGVCTQHGSLVRATVWTIRHNATKDDVANAVRTITDTVTHNGNGKSQSWRVRILNEWFNRAPYAVVALAAIAAWIYGKSKGWL